MQIDFGRTSADYAAYRIQYPPLLFDRLRRGFAIGLPDQRILDVAAGTGLFGCAIASKGCRTILLDVSSRLLICSDQPNGVVARVEFLPFGVDSFDVVTAAQCWHWFDRRQAPQEILRVLRPGGSLAAIYQTYIPLSGSVAEATEQLILRHQPGWRHANSTGINGQVLRDMQSAGFVRIESFSFDIDVTFSQDQWRGFTRTTSPVGASMAPAQVLQFDREHQTLLASWPPTLVIPHRVFAAIARKPGSRL
jgi:SAM-dependent methyltransferase